MEDEAEVGDGEGPDGQERWRMRHRFGKPMRQKWGVERGWMSIERWRMKQRWAMERGQMGKSGGGCGIGLGNR